MAVEFPRIAVPELPPKLRRLFFYLADRDVGAPSVLPVPGNVTVADQLDLLTWDLNETEPPGQANFRRADGFLLAVATGDTDTPWTSGAIFRLSIQCRNFLQTWTASTTRSYAIAAFRNTWQGEHATGWVQPDSWKGISP